MKINFRKTNLESWVEWRRRCALAECGAETQSDIQDWAVPILLNAEKQNGATEEESEERGKRGSNGVSDAWRDLEHRMEQKTCKESGKPWKNQICDLIDDLPDDATDDDRRDKFEAQIQLRKRDWATAERRAIEKQKKVFPHSAQEPVSRQPDAPTFGEIFGTASELAPDVATVWNELCEYAEEEANTTLSRFSTRERFALGCKSKRVALYLSEVLQVAECGQTQLNEAFNKGKMKFQTALDEMRAKYAEKWDSEILPLFLEEFSNAFLDCCQEIVPPEILRLGRS